MTESSNLLAEYVQTGSDTAFRELVARYLGLVYSTALRLVAGDSYVAEDVAQTVFLDLARKAGTLPSDVMLGGWLHRDTCFVAAHTMRGERRRQVRERQAVEMNALQSNPEADFSPVARILDEAINELADADRTAILLRFFEQRDFRSVGQALGSNEDAARMRVNRALEKLQGLLTRRGLTTSAAALSVALWANAVQAAPAGLAVTISTAVAIAEPTVAATAAITAAKTIAMTTLQKALIGATLAASIGTTIFEARHASTLQTKVQTLEQQLAPLFGQAQQLSQALNAATQELARLREENQRLNGSTAELLKLRGEAARLRAVEHQLAQSTASGQKADDPFTQSVLALTARAAELNQRLQQAPQKQIPELQFLTENDWLDAARDAQLESDAGVASALSKLRSLAKSKFAPLAARALDKYLEANHGQLPVDASQLKPYFEPPVADALLERYKILQTGNVKDLAKDAWILGEKAPVDKDCDSHLYIGAHGRSASYGTGPHEIGDPDESWAKP